MNITDFKESLDYLFKAQLTPYVWSHAGVGKTESISQYAKSKGYHFFPLHLGTMSDLGDILGLAEFVDNGDGSKSTEFATPKWLTDVVSYCNANPDSGAIIFLDEFNRGRRDILNGMFSLALDKTFHTIKLPKNCYVIAAGNPPTDEYFTTDVDETALMARFVHIKLDPTVSEWVQYAKERKIEPTLVGFIQDQPNLLEATRTEFDLNKIVKVDRRAYERLSRLFEIKTPQHLMDSLIPGIIGLERTIAYKQYLKEVDKPLTGDQILKHERPDLIEKWSNPVNVEASFLNITCDNVKEVFEAKNVAKQILNSTEKSNFMWFLTTIPKDISFSLIKALVISSNETFKDFSIDPVYEKPLAELTLTAKGIVTKKEGKK